MLRPLAVVACLAAPATVLAAEHAHESDSGHEHDHAPAEEAPVEAATITVHGEGPPRSASEATRGRAVIAAAPHRTAADVLLVVPGVFITQHSGQGKAYQIFFRGFDAVHGQDVELSVGGVPVNEVSNVHGQGYADLHFVMPEVVREVRSLPGTYSPRQGDFAVAGSIRFDLGFDEPGVTTKATVGSFGERRWFVAYHPPGSDPSTFGAFETQTTDGFGPSRAARRTSAIGQHVFSLGHGLDLRVLATAYAARFDSAGVVLRSDLDRGLDPFATYDPKQGGFSSRSSLVLDLTHGHPRPDGLEDGRWSLAPFVIFRSLSLRQNFTGFLERGVEGDSVQQSNEAVTLGATASYRRSIEIFGPSDAIEAGLYARTDWITQSQRALGAVDDRVLATTVDARVRATNAAGWIDAALKPIKRVTLRGGVRVDGLAYLVHDATGQARSAMGTHVGPKATVDVRVAGGLHAVASYGEGFRSPQARSLGDGERTPFARVRSFELGLRHQEGDLLRASASVFRTTLSEDLVFDPATARNERVPGTNRHGAALEYVLTPRAWFVSSGSATYTRAAFASGDATYGAGDLLPYVPQLVIRQDAAVTPVIGHIGNRALRARLGVALTGLFRRPLPYGEYARDIALVDASIGARLGEVELGLDVFNLLGTRWFDGTFVFASNWDRGAAPSLVPREHVTLGAPRAVLATLTLHL